MHDFQIEVARDSVCMGDDVDAPHDYSFTMPAQATLNDVFEHLAGQHYLASVSGKNHSWEAFIKDEKIALFKGNNPKPEPSEFLNNKISKYILNDKLIIYIVYKSARD